MDKKKLNIKSEYFVEIVLWLIILFLVIFKRFTPSSELDNDILLMYAGGVLIFALIYYYVIYKIMPYAKRQWVKTIGEVMLIGILIALARNFGVYLSGLFFIPIAGSMFILGTVNGLLIAVLCVIIVAMNFFLVQNNLMAAASDPYSALFPLVSIVIVTIYTRSLSHQITHQKNLREEAETKLQTVNKKFKEFEELEKEFVSLTAHQLYTPLSVIRGFLSMFLKNNLGPINEKQKKYISESYQYTVRMVKLIHKLLNITHIESGDYDIKPKPVDILKIINQIKEELALIAKDKKIEIVITSVDLSQTEAMADEDKIPEIFSNIIDNAIRYSPPDSKVEISAHIIHRDNKPFLSVAITDHGVGIPLQEQEHIFQRFFRATNILSLDNHGSGLGLFIAKRLIEQQGGTISFESKENEGTTFTINLPAVAKT